jgi:Dolichyl-phosphate-mannose-protein mannosyltransferase
LARIDLLFLQMPGWGTETTVTRAHATGGESLACAGVAVCRRAVARSRHNLRARFARANACDLASLLLFAALVLLVAFTFRDYAISNDEEVQQHYGELIVRYYASGFADQSLFHFRDLYLYGGLFDLLAVGIERLVPVDPYAVRHLLSALTGVGGIVAAWATARAIGVPRAGFLAAAALAVCGVWYGAMFNHTKDIPFAAAMMGAVYVLLRLGRELPRPRWHLIVAFGLLCGCALGIRVFGLFLIGYALLAVAIFAPRAGSATRRRTLDFAARAAIPLAAAFAIAYPIMIAAWPWAGLEPFNPLRAVSAFAQFHYPINTVLAGRVFGMADVPRWYVPTYIAIKLTLPLLLGAGLALLLTMLPRWSTAPANVRRKEVALIALTALLPLVCDVAIRGPADTGMRHFLFIVPPIAVLAGLGLDGALNRLGTASWFAAAAGLAMVLVSFGWNATTLYRLHPEEYLFYNPLVGGLAGASRRYATDYWVNIMPEAVGDLERFLDRTEHGTAEKRLRRHYLVFVCGERLPFEKEADARLEWTRDRDRAEFFIAPTHMNCDRMLGGRVVATVERLGVVIGVVKDRRAVMARAAPAYSGAGSPIQSAIP